MLTIPELTKTSPRINQGRSINYAEQCARGVRNVRRDGMDQI